MRQYINIITEAEEEPEAEEATVMAADAPEEVTQITEQFAETIFNMMKRAKYRVERRYDAGSFSIEGFNPYPDFQGHHSGLVFTFSTEGGVTLLSRVTSHKSKGVTKDIEFFTMDKLAEQSLERFKGIMGKILKLYKYLMFGLGITNRMHSFGANVLKAHGINMLRARK